MTCLCAASAFIVCSIFALPIQTCLCLLDWSSAMLSPVLKISATVLLSGFQVFCVLPCLTTSSLPTQARFILEYFLEKIRLVHHGWDLRCGVWMLVIHVLTKQYLYMLFLVYFVSQLPSDAVIVCYIFVMVYCFCVVCYIFVMMYCFCAICYIFVTMYCFCAVCYMFVFAFRTPLNDAPCVPSQSQTGYVFQIICWE